jgi:hypothetical protein
MRTSQRTFVMLYCWELYIEYEKSNNFFLVFCSFMYYHVTVCTLKLLVQSSTLPRIVKGALIQTLLSVSRISNSEYTFPATYHENIFVSIVCLAEYFIFGLDFI